MNTAIADGFNLAWKLSWVLNGYTIFYGALLAVGVAVLQRGLVGLVEASGARDQPAVILILLLAAFLGLLTAVAVQLFVLGLRLLGIIEPGAAH